SQSRWLYAVLLSGVAAGNMLASPLQTSRSAPAPGSRIVDTGPGVGVVLPAPYATRSASNRSRVIGWKTGQKPTVPPGFEVSAYASGLDAPRWSYVLPNGDVLVALSLAHRIVLFRDANRDGVPEMHTDFLTNQYLPFGMLLLGNSLYVGNSNAVMRF